MIPVLDHGYVRIADHMGGDLSVVNAARVSFAKASDIMSESDRKLLEFLIREEHTSPFRHAFVTLEVKAPLMVARQWWKYIVGSDHTMDAWNESSRRYITEEPEFYQPTVWRSAPESKKQGSGEPVGDWISDKLTMRQQILINRSLDMYHEAIEHGVAVEQARLFLPAYAMYVRWRWSASLQSVMHFLEERLEDDAQMEIQAYAAAVHQTCKGPFPLTMAYLSDRLAKTQ